MATAEKGPQTGEKQNANSLLTDALNKADFVAYLEKVGSDVESLSPENPDSAKKLETFLKAFESVKLAKKEIRTFAKGKLKELNPRLKLEEADLVATDAAIEKMAIEDPEQAAALVEKITSFAKLEAEVATAEQEFKKLDTESEKYWEEGVAMGLRASKEAERKPTGREKAWLIGKFLRKKTDEEESFEKKFGVKVEDAANRLKAIQEAKGKVSTAEALASSKASELGDLKRELMQDAGVLKDLRDQFAKKIAKRSIEIMEGEHRLSELEEERKMRAAYSSGELSDTFNLEEVLTDNADRDLEHVDQLIGTRVYEDMKAEIAKPWGSRPLDDVKKNLKSFRERTELMGKKGQEAKDIVIATLERIRDEQRVGDMRKVFIGIIIQEMRGTA